MQRIFPRLKFRRLRIKLPFQKESLASKIADLKTEVNEYNTMPKTFDFTAYFDDNESESIPNDIACEIPHMEVDTNPVKNTLIHYIQQETRGLSVV